MKSFSFPMIPGFSAAEAASHRLRNSLEMRSLRSPEAMPTKYGLVFDQDGAVIASVRSWSMSSSGTGVVRKSLVVRLDARNSLNCVPLVSLFTSLD